MRVDATPPALFSAQVGHETRFSDDGGADAMSHLIINRALDKRYFIFGRLGCS